MYQLKSNQSIHISIQEPPNPKPISSLAILQDPDNPNIPQLIQLYLSGIIFQPKDTEFIGNVKDEVLKLLGTTKVIGVARKGNLTTVVFQHD